MSHRVTKEIFEKADKAKDPVEFCYRLHGQVYPPVDPEQFHMNFKIWLTFNAPGGSNQLLQNAERIRKHYREKFAEVK